MLTKNKEIKIFLKKITKGIWNPMLKREIQLEFRSHIEDKIADQVNCEDIKYILAEFGDPDEINKLIKEQHKFNMKKYPILLSIAIFIFLVSGLQFYYVYNFKLYKNIVSIEERNLGFFLDNQKILAQDSFFLMPTLTANAGEVLDDMLYKDDDEMKVKDVPKLTDLQIAELNSPDFWSNQKYLTTILKPEYSNLDLSWIEKLKKYDHWKISLSKSNTLSVLDAKMVRALLRLYLSRGLRDDDLESRLPIARHFTRLVYTQPLISSNFLALQLLGEESQVFEEGKKFNNKLSWTPISKNTRKIAQFNHWTAIRLLDFTADKNLISDLLQEDTINICSSAFEAISRFESASFIRHQVFEKSVHQKQIEYFEVSIMPHLQQKCGISPTLFTNKGDESAVLAIVKNLPFIENLVAANYFE